MEYHAYADKGGRTPIGASGNYLILLKLQLEIFLTFLISLPFYFVADYYDLQVALDDLFMIWKYMLQIFNNQSGKANSIQGHRVAKI